MYDVAIIGAGPAGYVAAIRAAQLGGKVILVEKDQPGGVCLNRGCIPTKALLWSAYLFSRMKEAESFGIVLAGLKADFRKMQERKELVVERLRTGVKSLLSARKVELVSGCARFLSPTCIDVNGHRIEAKNVLIATGSMPFELPAVKFDHTGVISSDDVLNLKELPQELLIVGGGVIGCEFATIFSSLGTKVTVMEMMDRILPTEDREISRRFEAILRKKGVEVLTKTKAEGIGKGRKVLVAVGRSPNSSGLGLEALGIATDKGYIKVDKSLRTNVPGVFAAGDVIGGWMLAHAASYEGITAVENMFGREKAADYSCVPNCIYTDPEIASVGLSEEEAKESGIEYKVAKFPFSASGKAQVMGDAEGFVKLLVDSGQDKILGTHILGPHATDLIAEIVLAMKYGIGAKEVAEAIHAHPTLAEAIAEVAHKASGMPIHTL